MQVTEEQLKVFPEEERPVVRRLLTKQSNPKAMVLKQEVHDWACARAYTDDGHQLFPWSQLVSSVNMAIKLKLSLKDIRKLTDEQVPEARKLFEKFKEDFDV